MRQDNLLHPIHNNQPVWFQTVVIRQGMANASPIVQKPGTQTVVVSGGQVFSSGQIVVGGNNATQVD